MAAPVPLMRHGERSAISHFLSVYHPAVRRFANAQTQTL